MDEYFGDGHFVCMQAIICWGAHDVPALWHPCQHPPTPKTPRGKTCPTVQGGVEKHRLFDDAV
eukprot:514758-Pelagomonas_calceolata.AAC.1